jgi:hypothetical protein
MVLRLTIMNDIKLHTPYVLCSICRYFEQLYLYRLHFDVELSFVTIFTNKFSSLAYKIPTI